jgi:hypothetical protein
MNLFGLLPVNVGGSKDQHQKSRVLNSPPFPRQRFMLFSPVLKKSRLIPMELSIVRMLDVENVNNLSPVDTIFGSTPR